MIISVVNHKGGVGKTTTTVALAETWASEYGRHVLVVDLDPQANAGLALVGEKNLASAKKEGKTIDNLFAEEFFRHIEPEKLNNHGLKAWDIRKAIIRGASNLKTARTLDLLASDIILGDIHDRIGAINDARGEMISVLGNSLRELTREYDVILIDCPPQIGIIAQNGIVMSDCYVIPVIPDHMSTYGIPQILRKIASLCRKTNKTVRCLGVIINKFQANSNVHRSYVISMPKQKFMPKIYSPQIMQTNTMSCIMDFGQGAFSTYRKKYGHMGEVYRKLGERVLLDGIRAAKEASN